MKKILFTIVALLLSSATWAQEIEKKEDLQGEASASLSALRLATDLVKYGYAQQSALPLIEALEIINENPTQSLNAEREGESVDTTQTDGKKGIVSMDTEVILKDAKEFAEGDDVLLQLIAQVEAEANNSHRGNVFGPSRTYEVVKANYTDTYKIGFVANSLAEIFVSGDGDTDLDLFVFDSNGNLIASDTDYTDDCYVSWIPAWTGRFTVKIVNRGQVYNRYVMLTN